MCSLDSSLHGRHGYVEISSSKAKITSGFIVPKRYKLTRCLKFHISKHHHRTTFSYSILDGVLAASFCFKE